MSMAYGLVGESRAKVQPGTVIKLTPAELNADPKDQSATKVKAIFESYRAPPKYHTHQVGPAKDLRTQILGMSLFPNVVNSKHTYKKGDLGTNNTGMAGV